MEHLCDKEIKAFISVSGTGRDDEALVKRVHRHIMECRECADKLKNAVRMSELLSAMTRDDFSLGDIFVSEYDHSPEAVRAAAPALEEEEEYLERH